MINTKNIYHNTKENNDIDIDIDVENLVFSGGNLKGVVYAGCLTALEEYNLILK